MKRLFKATLFSSILFTAGCATIVSDSNYPVTISSEPTGQKFEIRNREGVLVNSGITPYTAILKAGAGYFKKEKYQITFTEGKYKGRSFILESEVDGWYVWGNLVFGGLIGYLIVDPLTGAMYKLPQQFAVNLEADTQPKLGLHILSIEHLTAEQRKHLEQINIEG